VYCVAGNILKGLRPQLVRDSREYLNTFQLLSLVDRHYLTKMWSNAVIDVHEDFDIVEFAETFFDTEKQLLIVLEKGKKLHWHVHGTWTGNRKDYKEIAHALRTGEGQRKTRPVRVAFDKDEVGFRYCCKEDPVNVVKKWHISDDQIAKWHDEWTSGKEDTRTCLTVALRLRPARRS